MTALLATQSLNKHFGALHATRNVTFTLEEGARHALIGPNGAGKTTFINLLTGVLMPTNGTDDTINLDTMYVQLGRKVQRHGAGHQQEPGRGQW